MQMKGVRHGEDFGRLGRPDGLIHPAMWIWLADTLKAPTNVGAFLLASLLAAGIAAWGVVTQRTIARRKATLDLIFRSQSDKDLIAARSEYVRLTKLPGGLAPWAEKTKEGSPESQSILTVLNEFEVVAIGIQRGIIEFELYKRWFNTATKQYWITGAPFILRLRARVGNDMLYHEFEELNRWLSENKKPKRGRFLGKWF